MVLVKGINVGSSEITASYADGSPVQTDSQTITVNSVELESIDTPENTTYNGQSQHPTPKVYALINGQPTELVLGQDYTLSWFDCVNAGQARVIATGKGNFTGSVESEWTINQKEVQLTWGDLTWTYDGNPHSTTCVVSNLEGNDTCSVILSGNLISAIGTTTVTAVGLDNDNYKLPVPNPYRILTLSPGMYVRILGVWTPVRKVYKKISGFWVLQDMMNAFSLDELYMKKEI